MSVSVSTLYVESDFSPRKFLEYEIHYESAFFDRCFKLPLLVKKLCSKQIFYFQLQALAEGK